jgi:hypothetical protein
MLAILRIKLEITLLPPRTRYPVVASLPGQDLHLLENVTLPGRIRLSGGFPKSHRWGEDMLRIL